MNRVWRSGGKRTHFLKGSTSCMRHRIQAAYLPHTSRIGCRKHGRIHGFHRKGGEQRFGGRMTCDMGLKNRSAATFLAASVNGPRKRLMTRRGHPRMFYGILSLTQNDGLAIHDGCRWWSYGILLA
jgi:hypothetical protein